MLKFLISVTLICLVTFVYAQTQCNDENEEYLERGFERSCSKPSGSFKSGCCCKSPLFRNNEGKCVNVSECPLKCGLNEVYNSCPAYCKLDDDCEYLLNNRTVPCIAPEDVDFPCFPRCECIPGTVKKDNKCVSPNMCCGNNEEAVDCPASCQETCTYVPPADCRISPCFKKTCKCINGYVKNSLGTCINRTSCPVYSATPTMNASPTTSKTNNQYNCPPNQIYSACVPMYEKTCLSDVTVPSYDCKPGCVCDSGFVRNGNECIPKHMCNTIRN